MPVKPGYRWPGRPDDLHRLFDPPGSVLFTRSAICGPSQSSKS